ncbi:MAG TPA: DUF2071 domain-containing protein [Holophagaceae bacterium]|jgi:hypothetical protein|nr:DUF2071 domain-containing protein [Holophagaceae bacterium]
MLKNALPMQSFIRRCWLVTHRVPEAQVRSLLPPELHPVTYGGFAFLNTVIARMEAMRPQGLPAFLGLDYWHVGYRIYAKALTPQGEQEGLYFLRSDCDRRLLTMAGNLFSDFRFHTARILVTDTTPVTSVRVEVPGADVELDLNSDQETLLAAGSPFGTLAEAEIFLKYKPCGLASASRGRVNAIPIQRDESAWHARPVKVRHQHLAYLDSFTGIQLELVFEIAPIEYRFGRGHLLEVR